MCAVPPVVQLLNTSWSGSWVITCRSLLWNNEVSVNHCPTVIHPFQHCRSLLTALLHSLAPGQALTLLCCITARKQPSRPLTFPSHLPLCYVFSRLHSFCTCLQPLHSSYPVSSLVFLKTQSLIPLGWCHLLILLPLLILQGLFPCQSPLLTHCSTSQSSQCTHSSRIVFCMVAQDSWSSNSSDQSKQ